MDEIIKQYFQMVPVRFISWEKFDFENTQLDLLNATVLYTLYPVSTKYSTSFLKSFILHMENQSVEVHEQILNVFASLIQTPNIVDIWNEPPVYKSYIFPDLRRIVTKEEQSQISHGTTGLRVWPAAKKLCSYFYRNQHIVKDKHILELGSGVGLVGLSCALFGAKTVLMTDFEPLVLDRMNENLRIFNEMHSLQSQSSSFTTTTSAVNALYLDWRKCDDAYIQSQFPIFGVQEFTIVCADLVYDPSIIPFFVSTLECFLSLPTCIEVFIWCTIRNPETWLKFLHTIQDSLQVDFIVVNQDDFYFFIEEDGSCQLIRITSKLSHRKLV